MKEHSQPPSLDSKSGEALKTCTKYLQSLLQKDAYRVIEEPGPSCVVVAVHQHEILVPSIHLHDRLTVKMCQKDLVNADEGNASNLAEITYLHGQIDERVHDTQLLTETIT